MKLKIKGVKRVEMHPIQARLLLEFDLAEMCYFLVHYVAIRRGNYTQVIAQDELDAYTQAKKEVRTSYNLNRYDRRK